jgi:hypothetical protein
MIISVALATRFPAKTGVIPRIKNPIKKVISRELIMTSSKLRCFSISFLYADSRYNNVAAIKNILDHYTEHIHLLSPFYILRGGCKHDYPYVSCAVRYLEMRSVEPLEGDLLDISGYTDHLSHRCKAQFANLVRTGILAVLRFCMAECSATHP